MKIRHGFVSNSSTSSFLIYGTTLTGDEYDEVDWKAVREAGLETHHPEYGDLVIGASWDTVKDDETGKQFKERVESAITKLIKREADCSTHEDAWYS
jgi:broad specificity phosphatase PhoE